MHQSPIRAVIHTPAPAHGHSGAIWHPRAVYCNQGKVSREHLPGTSLAPPWHLPGISLAPPWHLPGIFLASLGSPQGGDPPWGVSPRSGIECSLQGFGPGLACALAASWATNAREHKRLSPCQGLGEQREHHRFSRHFPVASLCDHRRWTIPAPRQTLPAPVRPGCHIIMD